MLARRFTIVCLLMALFGMYMASLVAEVGRYPRAQENRNPLPCFLDPNISCRR